MIDKNTLIGWFKRGMKPLASQYEAWLNSYWHKSEKLPVTSINELETILNDKADISQLDGKADKVHGHVITDVNDLQDTLDEKANVDHTHVINDVNSLQAKLDALQAELDSLKKITMIRGNVDTYADLWLLDTANIREGDSYIVEVDETKEGKSTLYVWSAGSWVYTGEWASGGADTNLGNSDLEQQSYSRHYNIGQGVLKFYSQSSLIMIENGILLGVQNIEIHIDRIGIFFRTGGEGFINDKFLYIGSDRYMQFLTANEFKAKLGL